MKYANQRNIVITRNVPSKIATEAKLNIYCRNLEAAARDLTGVAFKLYCYLASFENGYSLDYSPQDLADKYGISINSARDAVRILIDKGYLAEIDNNEYLFKEVPYKGEAWDYL